MNKTIHQTKTKKVTRSKRSSKKSLNVLLVFPQLLIISVTSFIKIYVFYIKTFFKFNSLNNILFRMVFLRLLLYVQH